MAKLKDMTTGSPMRIILGFSIPIFFGALFQQIYAVVDTFIVGRILGVNALAAVGSTGSLNFLVIGFCMGICSGFAIPLAHRFGAGDYRGLRKYMMNSIYLSAVFALVITIVTVIFCMPILKLMRTPNDIIDQAYVYIVIIFIGIPVTFLYNLVSGIIRSLGDSKTPVIFLVIASAINIVLDIVFIAFLNMGVAGAAWATVISQAFSGVACVIYSYKKFDILHGDKDEKKIDGQDILRLLGMGIPMGLQYSITAIGTVVLQGAVNSLGSAAVAAMTAGGRISGFFCCPFDALGSTMSTFGGQNVGAKKLERVTEGLKDSCIIGVIYSVGAFIFMIFFGNIMTSIFVSDATAEVISNSHYFLIANSAFFILLAFVNIVRFLIQGMGYSTFAILAGVFEMVARCLVAFALVPVFGFKAACFANAVAWIFADMFLFPAYFHVYNKTKKIFDRKNEAH